MAGGIIGGETIAHNAALWGLGRVGKHRFERLIDCCIGVGTNEDTIAAVKGEFCDRADHFGLAGAGRSPEKEEIMGHGPDQGVELFGIQRGIWRDGELVGELLRDGGRVEAFHRQFGEIVLGMRLDGGQALIEREQEAHAIDGEPGLGNFVVEFSRKRQGQLIDREAQDDAGMRTAVDDKFTLRIVEIALQRHHGTAENHAVMPAAAALDTAIAERHAQRFPLMGCLPGADFVAEGIAERGDEFMERGGHGWGERRRRSQHKDLLKQSVMRVRRETDCARGERQAVMRGLWG